MQYGIENVLKNRQKISQDHSFLSSELFSILINNMDNELENTLIKFSSNIWFGEVTGMVGEMIKNKILRSWRWGLKKQNII